MTIDEMIEVLQAAKRGEKIQWQYLADSAEWHDDEPVWNFKNCRYRAKPKPLEGWINLYPDDGHVSDDRIHKTRECADASAFGTRIRCVHVREVEE